MRTLSPASTGSKPEGLHEKQTDSNTVKKIILLKNGCRDFTLQRHSKYTEFTRKMMKWRKSSGFFTKATVLGTGCRHGGQW